jgi:hypothetical protein
VVVDLEGLLVLGPAHYPPGGVEHYPVDNSSLNSKIAWRHVPGVGQL